MTSLSLDLSVEADVRGRRRIARVSSGYASVSFAELTADPTTPTTDNVRREKRRFRLIEGAPPLSLAASMRERAEDGEPIISEIPRGYRHGAPAVHSRFWSRVCRHVDVNRTEARRSNLQTREVLQKGRSIVVGATAGGQVASKRTYVRLSLPLRRRGEEWRRSEEAEISD